MEFLDEVVVKAKDVLEVTYKKAEEAVTTGKHKLEIATLENKISKDFEALGKIYFEAIKDKDDLDSKTATVKASIIEKKNKIEAIKEELVK